MEGFEPTGMEPKEREEWEKEKEKEGYDWKKEGPINQGIGVCEIVDFLTDDIQKSLDMVDSRIDSLEGLVDSNSIDDYVAGIANVHWLVARQGKVLLACEFVKAQRVLLSLEQMLHVLRQYKVFLEGDYNDPESVFEPIDVEIIAEGEEAIKPFEALEGDFDLSFIGCDDSY